MDTQIENRQIPVKLRHSDLSGLGDLLDDYSRAVPDFSDAYVWVMKNRAAVAATGSDKLMAAYEDLLLKGEGWRQMVSAYHVEPSVWGWLSNIFGTVTQAGTLDIGGKILSSTELGGIVHGLQRYVQEVKSLQLSIDQFKRMIAAGVPAGQAIEAIETANTGFFEQVTGALKWPAIGLGAVVLIGALVIFAPEIKAGFKAIKSKAKR